MSDRQGKDSSNDVVTFATLTGLLAFIPISTDLYLPAIPTMAEALGTSVSSSQLTLSLFMLGVAFGQVIFGPLSDHYGRLPVARAGCILFVGFSLVSALAWSIEYMWLARICQGATAASGAVIARAMIRDRYIGDRAAQMMALTSASMASVPLLAPTLGAYITVELGWRFTFAAQAIFGAAVLIGLATFEEVTHETSDAPESKLTFRSIVNTFRVCLQNPLFIGYQMAGTLSFCALFVYLSTVSFFLPDVFGVPTEYFGLAFAMTVTGFIVGSLASARLVMTWGQNRILQKGALVCIVSNTIALLLSLEWLFPTVYWSASRFLFALLSIVFFFGIGLISANASMGAVSLYPDRAGAASAVYGCVHSLSAASVGAIAGLTYDGRLLEPLSLMFLCSCGAFAGSAVIGKYRKNDMQTSKLNPQGYTSD